MPDVGSVGIALARGQIEEAIGFLTDHSPPSPAFIRAAYRALLCAREALARAVEAEAARVPMALYTPIGRRKS